MDGISFGSDNHSGIHPKVLEMMATANVGHVIAYGEDAYTKQAESLIKEHFGSASTFYPVFNGTGANVLSLKAATRPFHSIICAKTAHINTDECGAPEHFTGCKLESIETDDGKLRPKDVAQKLQGRHDEHHNQPRIVSITQATEVGTTYTPEEVRALIDFIKEHPINMIQWRNLNYDPVKYLKLINKKPSMPLGMQNILRQIRENFPNLKYGYFNPPKEKFR